MFYKLDGHTPVKCATCHEWAEWFEPAAASGKRIVAHDEIGRFVVSTVFVGIDPSAIDRDPPLLFETMTFENGKTLDRKLYATWELAEAGHRETFLGLPLVRFKDKPVRA